MQLTKIKQLNVPLNKYRISQTFELSPHHSRKYAIETRLTFDVKQELVFEVKKLLVSELKDAIANSLPRHRIF